MLLLLLLLKRVMVQRPQQHSTVLCHQYSIFILVTATHTMALTLVTCSERLICLLARRLS